MASCRSHCHCRALSLSLSCSLLLLNSNSNSISSIRLSLLRATAAASSNSHTLSCGALSRCDVPFAGSRRSLAQPFGVRLCAHCSLRIARSLSLFRCLRHPLRGHHWRVAVFSRLRTFNANTRARGIGSRSTLASLRSSRLQRANQVCSRGVSVSLCVCVCYLFIPSCPFPRCQVEFARA